MISTGTMHGTTWRTRFGRWARPLAAVAVGATLLAACGSGRSVEVRATPPARRPAPPAPPPATSVFQGTVESLDAAAGQLVVSVDIVWTPAVQPTKEDRRVTTTPATTWDPPGAGLAGLQVGQPIQVRADPGPDGTWVATEVRAVDVD